MSTVSTPRPQFAPTPPSRRGRAVGPWHAVSAAAAAMIGYLLSVLAADTAPVHWPPPIAVAGLVVPAGTVFAGTSPIARDLVHDTLGVQGVAVGIGSGAGCPPCRLSPATTAAPTSTNTTTST